MKIYWFICKEIATGKHKEIGMPAKNAQDAEKKFEKQKEYIPLEPTGWTEQMTLEDYIKY